MRFALAGKDCNRGQVPETGLGQMEFTPPSVNWKPKRGFLIHSYTGPTSS